MNQNQKDARVYPMKKHWQTINQILGLWAWLSVIAGSLFLLLVFDWARKVIPACRKMMAGGSRSYLRVSEDGLEYRNWPFWELRCAWGDVKGINKSAWFGDSLALERAEAIGFPEFSIHPGQPQIHLSSLAGWPDGGLEADLHRYAPQVFGR
jgi:hypothetical protein